MGIQAMPAHQPVVRHPTLKTTFTGIQHALSTPEAPVYQFRGIKYATFPARFRQSKLFTSYLSRTDATRFGPICPQRKGRPIEEELFGFTECEFPRQNLKQIESECLNLNITCPGGLNRESRVPVMLWIHGGNRGSGSHWLYDGGALVQNSILFGKPIMLVTINFRLGIFGFAASPKIREENEAYGDDGVGNYGLRDQQRALEWVYHFIADFGGNPSNITLFGGATGAMDILCHLVSRHNASLPLFRRAIIQSAIIDCSVPEVPVAGAHLSRLMGALHISSLQELRSMDAAKLANVKFTARAVDDGVFFSPGWREVLFPKEPSHARHHHLNNATSFSLTAHSIIEHRLNEHHSTFPPAKTIHLNPHHFRPPITHGPFVPSQPIIIGDCGFESHLYALEASLWTPPGVVRRLKALCQSLTRASGLLRAYDISANTPREELPERVLDLINDARFAWPTDCMADALQRAHGGGGVWRYVFDQETPRRGTPHHGADLLYLFDTARPLFPPLDTPAPTDGYSDDDTDTCDADTRECDDDTWATPVVDAYTYAHVRDVLQDRWIAFAHGAAPWSEDNVFVFGPEGETGERGQPIFEGRRRREMWKVALEPLGRELVNKVGIELSNGPVECADFARF